MINYMALHLKKYSLNIVQKKIEDQINKHIDSIFLKKELNYFTL